MHQRAFRFLTIIKIVQKKWYKMHVPMTANFDIQSNKTWRCVNASSRHCWLEEEEEDTVCSWALACSSHSSTSPPGLLLTQTHSWAHSCPTHQQCRHATSQLSQHMDWQPYCTLADKEQELSHQIAGYKLTTARVADSTALYFSAGQTWASEGQS